MLLVYFSRIDVKSKYIITISKLTFGIYLFHDNKYIRKYMISDRFIFINKFNIFYIIFYSIVMAMLIFVFSSIIEYLRQKLFVLLKEDNIYRVIIAKIVKITDKITIYL